MVADSVPYTKKFGIMSSPTQRTRALLKKTDTTNQIVEKWNPHARIRVDLFEVIDVLAITDTRTIGIQASSDSGRSKRRAKILLSEKAYEWTICPDRELWLITWGKKGPRGKRKLWTPYTERFDIIDGQMFAVEDCLLTSLESDNGNESKKT